MKISTKSRYGLRALAYLAKKGEICSIREIGKKENISFDYLEKIFLKLKKKSLVKVKRGAKGGYFLARSPEKITLGEIIGVLENKTAPVSCVGKEKIFCPRKRSCLVKNVWKKVQRSWESTIDSVTLAEAIK